MKLSAVTVSPSGAGSTKTVESDQPGDVKVLLDAGHQLVSESGEVAIRKVDDSYIVDVTEPAARKAYRLLRDALDRAEEAVEEAKEG